MVSVFVLYDSSRRLPITSISDIELLSFKADWHTRFNAFEDDFIKVGDTHDIDWTLLCAVGYQESKWRPDAVSKTGVRGMMMLTTATAKEVGIDDRTDPTQSIVGAARYLQHLVANAPPSLKDKEKTWFAVSAYNAGRFRMNKAFQRWSETSGSTSWRDFEHAVLRTSRDAKIRNAIRYTRRIRDFQMVAIDLKD